MQPFFNNIKSAIFGRCSKEKIARHSGKKQQNNKNKFGNKMKTRRKCTGNNNSAHEYNNCKNNNKSRNKSVIGLCNRDYGFPSSVLIAWRFQLHDDAFLSANNNKVQGSGWNDMSPGYKLNSRPASPNTSVASMGCWFFASEFKWFSTAVMA